MFLAAINHLLTEMTIILFLSASPAYNAQTRNRYVVFPTAESSRDIQLHCDIRPGALGSRYSVEWLGNSVSLGYQTFDISVSLRPSSSTQQYLCRVTIVHRNDTESSEVYNGPAIMLQQRGIIACFFYTPYNAFCFSYECSTGYNHWRG